MDSIFFYTKSIGVNIRNSTYELYHTSTKTQIHRSEGWQFYIDFRNIPLLYFSEDTRVDQDASDSVGQKGLICWMWTTTVSAALGNKHCHVRHTFSLRLSVSLCLSVAVHSYPLNNFFVSMQ